MTQSPPRNTEYSLERRGLSHLAHIRETFSENGLSEGVIQMLNRSSKRSAEAGYSSSWRKWNSWCIEWYLNPSSAPLSQVLQFLLGVIFNRKQYCTVNTIRTPLLTTQRRIEGLSVGQHQLASLFMTWSLTVDHQPINNYTATWDICRCSSQIPHSLSRQPRAFPVDSHTQISYALSTNQWKVLRAGIPRHQIQLNAIRGSKVCNSRID